MGSIEPLLGYQPSDRGNLGYAPTICGVVILHNWVLWIMRHLRHSFGWFSSQAHLQIETNLKLNYDNSLRP